MAKTKKQLRRKIEKLEARNKQLEHRMQRADECAKMLKEGVAAFLQRIPYSELEVIKEQVADEFQQRRVEFTEKVGCEPPIIMVQNCGASADRKREEKDNDDER